MSYVPTYLEYQPRQADGWPKGISEESKTWATNMVRQAVSFAPMGLDRVRYLLFRDDFRPAEFRDRPLLDYQFAVAHRALLACDAENVWTIPKR